MLSGVFRSVAAWCPNPRQRALLTDARFILEPNFHGLVTGVLRQNGRNRLGNLLLAESQGQHLSFAIGYPDWVSETYIVGNFRQRRSIEASMLPALNCTKRSSDLTRLTETPLSLAPAAKMFYVAFTADGLAPAARPVTFFYNGGPGSSSVWVLLGSFGPRRIKTKMPSFTPPAPYTLEDNPDTLLDRSDLVFINPVGTGYSAAIALHKNKDFWGVDQDASSIKQYIKRYLTAYDRWNSPKFLFGESYGTARSCVLAWLLHEDGVDLNGITLVSSILDYSQSGNPVGLLPTLAADAWFHKKITLTPPPADLASFMQVAVPFAEGPYATALSNPATVQTLTNYIGISTTTLDSWLLDVAATNRDGTLLFLLTLMKAEGGALGAYDGKVVAIDTGIAASISPNSGGNDPTMTAVNGIYMAMWNVYLNDKLKFTSTSSFIDLNDQAFIHWDFGHIDPTGAQKGKHKNGNIILYTAGDLAESAVRERLL